MKPHKTTKIILNDQDLIDWHQKSPPVSYKKKLEFALIKLMRSSIEYFLRGIGMYSKGRQNSLDLQVRHFEFKFPDLPVEFDGTRILFLTDLHLGQIKELPDIILEKMRGLEYDLCLLGGDYRFCFVYPGRPFFSELETIVSQIHAPLGIYGVLGNHDELEFIPAFEKIGIKILLNSSVPIQKGGQTIYLTGVDEIFYSRRHDLRKAFEAVPQSAFSIFLGHSPDIYDEVEAYGARLYLCGHTHQGQIRFPWIGPVFTNTVAPRKFSGGYWQYKNLIGYTGAGVGSGVHLVRFLCPPEIAVITLRRK